MKTGAIISSHGDGWDELRVSTSERRAPLSDCVRDALQCYLDKMDGHPVNDLYRLVIEEVERPMLQTLLDHTGGNQTRAAQLLGISRSTLRKKIADYGLPSDR
ncbi:DNA-binding transcriptional regulator Fis [Thiococcus pfennigii]|jgi:Fis family transcriptional regulator|uniref:DNA-binding transcriptional regulator Fis n=1 Tax=Thiococcus pfennigii TaxID=1057 RepID=UPI0019074142|nr:DNA-binding transcriptional regulator Fis [Thiococcus pfennigii]MBK1701697.1 Fis family transcriptional regulator [Thiococcus pfennigii]MBK1732960.1 Fis family transcriptional regulator [Thiococcus pfennigii]